MVRLTLFALFVTTTLASAGDWPSFRGPKRDNHSPDKGLLNKWPEKGPILLWKATDVGVGFSSVSIVGEHVYTMGSEGKDGRGPTCLYALDRKAGGKPIWEVKLGDSGDGGGYRGPRCTPTVDGGLVYALSHAGDFVCVEASTGKEKWRKNFRKDYGGQSGGWEYAESPLIDGDRLVCTPGGSKATLLVLNKKTGEEILKAPLNLRDKSAGYSSIVISHAGGVKQYVTLLSAGTVGVDANTGKLLWHYDKLGNNTANAPMPIVLGDFVFSTAGYGKGGALLKLSKDGDGVKHEEVYYEGRLTNKHGGVVVVGDYIYGDRDDGGDPFCAEWKTGKVVWQRSRSKGKFSGHGSASMTYADGHLYIRYADGTVVLAPATPAGYKETSSFKIINSDSNSWAHPVVLDGRLYLREKSVVWCYDVKHAK